MSSSGKVLYLGLDPSHYSTTGEITHWPIIQIVPRPFDDLLIQKALENFDRYTHLVFTSKNTVEILKSFLIHYGISLSDWAAKKNLAVGKVTAKHLETAGVTPLTAVNERAEGLIDLIQSLQVKESHFFWPHSAKSRPVLEDYFQRQQIPFTSCILYNTESHLPSEMPHLDHFEEIVFTSPSTIDAFLKIFKKFPSCIRLTSIGPVTEAHLNSLISR